MNIYIRCVLLICSVVPAYLAAWIGDFAATDHTAHEVYVYKWIVACISFLVLSGYLGIIRRKRSFFSVFESIAWAEVCFICIAFLYGLIVQPIEQYGIFPSHWDSPWMLLFLIGVLPILIEVKRLIVDERELYRESLGVDHIRENPIL